jgi:rhodanese-related sulfurtransferase
MTLTLRNFFSLAATLLLLLAGLAVLFSAPAEIRPTAAKPAAAPRFTALVEDAKRRIRRISPQELKARLAKEAGTLYVIDVREDGEWAAGRLPEALHLSRGVLERDIETLIARPDAAIALYCGSGARSALAAESLGRMGYTDVVSLEGGYRAWVQAGFPTVRD